MYSGMFKYQQTMTVRIYPILSTFRKVSANKAKVYRDKLRVEEDLKKREHDRGIESEE